MANQRIEDVAAGRITRVPDDRPVQSEDSTSEADGDEDDGQEGKSANEGDSGDDNENTEDEEEGSGEEGSEEATEDEDAENREVSKPAGRKASNKIENNVNTEESEDDGLVFSDSD